jgi:hypothetical protein
MEIGNYSVVRNHDEDLSSDWYVEGPYGSEGFETRAEAVAWAREQHANDSAEERAEADDAEAEAIRDDIKSIIDSADLKTLRRILKMMKK